MPMFPTIEKRNAYIEHERSFDHKQGDKVFVFRKAETYEDGWYAFWAPPMDNTVGKTGYVFACSQHDGTGILIDFRDLNTFYWYPYTCLRIIR